MPGVVGEFASCGRVPFDYAGSEIKADLSVRGMRKVPHTRRYLHDRPGFAPPITLIGPNLRPLLGVSNTTVFETVEFVAVCHVERLASAAVSVASRFGRQTMGIQPHAGATTSSTTETSAPSSQAGPDADRWGERVG